MPHTTDPVRILHLDDNPQDAQLVRFALEAAHEQIHASVNFVQTREQFLAALDSRDFDVILSDYRMPGFDGDAALEAAREKCPEIPFIMVTGELGEERAVEMLQRGATDYVIKDRIYRLVPAIKRAIAEADNARRAREVDEALIESEDRFRTMADFTPVMIWVTDASGGIKLVNKAWEEFFGITEREAKLPGRWQMLLHPEDAESYAGIYFEALRTHTPFEAEGRVRHKSGQWRWVHSFGTPRFNARGEFVGHVGNSPDITSQKEAELALKQSEKRLQAAHQETLAILGSFQDPLYMLDSQWRFIYANDQVLEFWKKRREEVLFNVVWEVFPTAVESVSYEALHQAMRERKSVVYEAMAVTTQRWVEVRAFPAAGGGLMVNFADISERKMATQRVEDLARFPGENPSPIVRVDTDGRLLYANAASAPLLDAWGATVGEASPTGLRVLVQQIREGSHSHGVDVPVAGRVFAFLGTMIPERGYVNLYGRDVTGQRRSEETLKVSEAKYRMLFKEIDEGFFLIDVLFDTDDRPVDLLYVEANAAATRMLGRDYTGKRLTEISPGYEPYWFEIFGDVALTGKSARLERYAAPDKRWYGFYVFKVGGPESRLVGNTFVDITERKRTEQALVESEGRFRALADNIPQLAWMTDDTGWIFWYNQRWFDYTGTTLEEMKGWGWQKVHHPDHVGRVTEKFRRAVEIGQSWEDTFPLRARDGRYRWFLSRAFPIRDGQGKVMRWFGSNTDITEQREAEEALRLSEEWYRTLFSTMIEGFCTIEVVFDAERNPIDYKFLETNAVFEEQTGLHEAQGKLMRSLAPDLENFWFETYGRIALTGEPAHFEHEATALGRWYEVSAFRAGKQEERKVAVLFNDITKRHRAEQEIRLLNESLEARVRERTIQLERLNRELESFSYSVSHDLRAPLRLITGFAELLGAPGTENLTAKQREYRGFILEETGRMEALIGALLEFSRLTRHEPRRSRVDTRRMVEEVITAQRQALGEEAWKRITVQLGEMPEIQADPLLIRQVFTNLLSNAFKFTRTVKEPLIRVTAECRDGRVVFSIADNGVGFPKEHAEKLFTVFRRLHAQTEFEGTGIGLANVRKIIERHGGTVCAEGEEGKGATFYFTLPVNR